MQKQELLIIWHVGDDISKMHSQTAFLSEF